MTSRIRALRVGALCAALLTPAIAVAGPSFDNVFVFGDSLSDTGNLAEIQAFLQNRSGPTANFPNPPFFHDSITNGPVAVELLAEHFGTRADPSLFATGFADVKQLGLTPGTNFAVAGATSTNRGQGIDLPQQIGAFTAHVGGQADPKSLYVVFIGGNDVRTAAKAGSTAFVTSGVAAEIAGVQALINDGAKHLLVVNVGNVGGIPEFAEQDPTHAAAATADSLLYDLLLAQGVTGLLGANPGAAITLFDFYAFSAAVAAHASDLGITNTTDPCLNSNFAPNANCFDPVTQHILFDKFLFWDNIHPTAEVQAAWSEGLIAAAESNAVPGPNTVVLLIIGLAGMAAGNWRRRKV
jgi:phospholipase/lecithinase/hemolysin